MKMENIEVFTNTKGKVVLIQESVDRNGDDQLIVLSAEQIDIVTRWMLIEKESIIEREIAGIPFTAEEEQRQPELPGLKS